MLPQSEPSKIKTCLKLSLTPAPSARSAIAYYVSASLLGDITRKPRKVPDKCKCLLAYLIAWNDVIRCVEIARVDLRARNKATLPTGR